MEKTIKNDVSEILTPKRLKTEIDYDYLKQIKDDENALYKYIEDNFVQDKYKVGSKHPFKNKCAGMKKICEVLGLIPSQDQFIFMMAEYQYVNNQAAAGAGKTTFSQLGVIKEKFLNGIDGKEVLCIAYNRRAAEDMLIRHTQLVNKLLDKYKGTAFKMDTYIETYTYHSFASFLVDEYKDEYRNKLGIFLKDKDYILSDSECRKIMETATHRYLTTDCRDEGIDLKFRKAPNVHISNLLSMYAWKVETLHDDYKGAETATGFKELLEVFGNHENLDIIFEYYRKIKSEKCMCDFSDLLEFAYKLICEPEVMARIRKLFKYIVFDEFQDASNNMFRTIVTIVKGDESLGIPPSDIKIRVIGDSDQMLYAFRGVDLNTSLKFKEVFGEGSKILSMAVNRRCLQPIVELSDAIIQNNTDRIIKPILATRPVSLDPMDLGKEYEECNSKAIEPRLYKQESEYINQIVEDLKSMKPSELGETAIIYRNRVSSISIARRLFKEKIPFRVSRGIAPYQDAVSRAIKGTLDLLLTPTNTITASENLHRVIPKSKGITNLFIRQVCNRERAKFNSDKDAVLLNFWDFDFKVPQSNVQFHNRLSELRKLSSRVKSGEALSTLIPDIVNVIDMRSLRFSDSMPPEFIIPEIIEDFKVDTDYREFVKELSSKLEDYKDKSESFKAVELTTFHSTKGLEFDTVYMIDMDDEQFPGRELSECEGNPALEHASIESCRRLLYVAVTRARNKLVIYISANNPSRFVHEFPDKFIPEEIRGILSSVNITDTEEKINLVEDSGVIVDEEMKIPDSSYLSSLNVISLECGNLNISGYFDGFVHAGDYLYDNKIEEDRLKKKQKASELLDDSIFDELFGGE